MAPKIQIALDTLDGQHALDLARLVAPYVDILEAGTPLLKSVGIDIVRKLKAAHPDKLVLADLKSSDVGAYEAKMAFEAGADITTTLGVTTLATIEEVQREADRWNRRCEVDMTGVADPVARAREVKSVGVSLVLYHRSIDEELTKGASWNDRACQIVNDLTALGIDVSVAGGVDVEKLPLLCSMSLYGIVVGRGITAQADPAAAALAIARSVKELWLA